MSPEKKSKLASYLSIKKSNEALTNSENVENSILNDFFILMFLSKNKQQKQN